MLLKHSGNATYEKGKLKNGTIIKGLVFKINTQLYCRLTNIGIDKIMKSFGLNFNCYMLQKLQVV